jgi:hypothetical protein
MDAGLKQQQLGDHLTELSHPSPATPVISQRHLSWIETSGSAGFSEVIMIAIATQQPLQYFFPPSYQSLYDRKVKDSSQLLPPDESLSQFAYLAGQLRSFRHDLKMSQFDLVALTSKYGHPLGQRRISYLENKGHALFLEMVVLAIALQQHLGCFVCPKHARLYNEMMRGRRYPHRGAFNGLSKL